MARATGPEVGLPVRVFLYTLDQIATILQVEEKDLRKYVHFQDRSVGARPLDMMQARNIAPAGEKPEWRVADRELERWLSRRGFRIYVRGWATK